MLLVQRFDLARLSPNITKTPQGFIRAPAFFTRVGVLEYERADGSAIRELRPPEEVFHKDSLASLSGAPLTREHPRDGLVNSMNAKELSIGFTGEGSNRQDTKVGGHVTVTEHAAIQDIAAGKLGKEISMGYNCSIDKTSGTHPVFGRYDQIQRNIRYNHAALLGEDSQGRAGEDIGLRLDSNGAIQRQDTQTSLERLVRQRMDLLGIGPETLSKMLGFEDVWMLSSIIGMWERPTPEQIEKLAKALKVEAAELTRLVPRVDSEPRRPIMEEIITIAGLEYTVPKNAAQAYRADSARRDEAAAAAKAESEKLQGRFDAQAEELKGTKDKIKELDSPERFDSAVEKRISLLGEARKVLGAEAKIEGTDRAIMEQTLRHDNKDLDLAKKSDDYVESRFDAMLEGLPAKKEQNANSSQINTRQAAHNAAMNGGSESRQDSQSAQQRMVERNRNAWKGDQKSA